MNQDSTHTIGNISRWEQLLFFTAIVSVFLATGFQTGISFIMLGWWIKNKGWRVAYEFSGPQTLGWWRTMRERLPPWWTMVVATVVLSVGTLFAFLGQRIFGPLDFHGAGADFSKVLRLLGKQGVYGLTMTLALMLAMQKGWRLEHVRKPVVGFLILYIIYMVAQRYTGIDWVHGFHARIGEHRFADGIYRPAGMASHPLTLAYAVMNLWVLFYARGLLASEGRDRNWEWSQAGLIFAIVFLSESRWVLVTMVLVVALSNWRTWLRYPKGMAAGVVVATVALVAEGRILHRFLEPFTNPAQGGSNFMRQTFWTVHLRLFSEWPIFGAGYPMSEATLQGHYDRLGLASFPEKYNAHNVYLQYLADMGIVGLLTFLVFLMAFMKATRQLLPGWPRATFTWIVFAGCFGCLMENAFRDHEFMYSWWLTLSIALAAAASSPRKA